jgi:hypothetical protein
VGDIIGIDIVGNQLRLDDTVEIKLNAGMGAKGKIVGAHKGSIFVETPIGTFESLPRNVQFIERIEVLLG